MRNGRCYNAQGVFRLAEFTKVDVEGGEENQGNRPTAQKFCLNHALHTLN